MRFPFLLLIFIFAAFVPYTTAATLHVPAYHPTIQSCIDAAVSGQDECVVAPGTYNELINFLGKAITLRSSHGPDVTIIDGTGLNGSVVAIISGEPSDTILNGFTITGGTGSYFWQIYPGINGGGLFIYNSSPTITNNIIRNNDVHDGDAGGGIYLRHSSGVITKNTIEANRAFDGGGLWIDRSSPELTDNVIRFNKSIVSSGGLGGRYCKSFIARNVFAGNQAHYGAAIGLSYSSPTMSNNIIVGNAAEAFGGGLFMIASSPMIRNVTITGNYAGLDGGALVYNESSAIISDTIIALNSSGIYQLSYSASTPAFMFCNVRGNGNYNFSGLGDPTGTDGNISQIPHFVRNPSDSGDGWGDDRATPDNDESLNDDYGDLRLQPGSPCINAGDPDFVPAPGETDLDDHARVLCGRIDMGAYEFGVGDFDCNQTIDLRDVAGLQNCFTGESASPYNAGCESLDFEFDADVDLSDLARFVLTANP